MGSSDMDKTPKEKESKTPPATSQVYQGSFVMSILTVKCLNDARNILLSSPGAVSNNWHGDN